MWPFRRTRVITCPETQQAAAVSLALFDASRLAACTRWPERAGCDQACLKQIASSPDGCLLHSIVASWYEGKSCVECKRPIGKIVWHEAPPALRLFDGTSHEWSDFLPQDLPSLFETSEPLCWYCNNVKELERIRPDLVVHRERPVEREEPLRSDRVY